MSEFEPRIVGFLCNWCSYAGADKAGSMQKPYPPNLNIVRVMCSGRVEPEFVMEAFKNGADGVLILACHPGDCHYKDGNYKAIQRYRLLGRVLEQMGVEKERLRLEYVSASEGDKFVGIVEDMVSNLKAIGSFA